MSFDDYLLPLPILPKDRFSRALATHGGGIIPLHPLTDRPLTDSTQLVWGLPCGEISERQARQLDQSSFNVGLLCGASSGCVALHVTTRAGQTWLEQQGLPATVQWFECFSRYYLFKSPGGGASGVRDVRTGVQLWLDGLFVLYPGSMWDDGRLVYWEHAPETVPLADLPDWLVARSPTA